MMRRLISRRVQASRYSAIRSTCQLWIYVAPGSTVENVLRGKGRQSQAEKCVEWPRGQSALA